MRWMWETTTNENNCIAPLSFFGGYYKSQPWSGSITGESIRAQLPLRRHGLEALVNHSFTPRAFILSLHFLPLVRLAIFLAEFRVLISNYVYIIIQNSVVNSTEATIDPTRMITWLAVLMKWSSLGFSLFKVLSTLLAWSNGLCEAVISSRHCKDR